jgi:hypothetical protein
MFCKQEIVMSDRGAGKWLPYDLNGTVHECKNKDKKPVQQSQQQKQTQERQQKPLTLEMMDIRLKRVEKVLFAEGMRTSQE